LIIKRWGLEVLRVMGKSLELREGAVLAKTRNRAAMGQKQLRGNLDRATEEEDTQSR
jgi:hypothetical protein